MSNDPLEPLDPEEGLAEATEDPDFVPEEVLADDDTEPDA